MTPEIPQSARDALARQTATEEHPSADLLNGFVERALSAAEEKRVTAHLAACAECREVVFLAGASADHPVAAAAGYEPVGTKARGRWRSWRWLAPVLAMAVVVAGIVVERQRSSTAHPAVGQTLAMNQSSARAALQPSNPAPDSLKAAAPPAPAQSSAGKPVLAKKAKGSDQGIPQPRERMLQRQTAASMGESLALSASPPPPPAVVAGAVGGNVPPITQAQSAARLSDSLQRPSPAAASATAAPGLAAAQAAGPLSPAASTAKAVAPMFAVQRRTASASWRITDDGHLERWAPSGAWTRVLADQPVSFHAVAVIANEVWAGGSDGALFHSADAGDHWTKVALTADGQHEIGTIVAIRFDSALQGSVTTASGTTWTTSDDGQSWSNH